jgi:hypothetical protein
MKVTINNHTPGEYINRYRITIEDDDDDIVQRWFYTVWSDVDKCSTSLSSWHVLEEYTLPIALPMDVADPTKTIATFKKLIMLQ